MNAKELTLRVVRLDDVLLHEQIEKKRVERLVKRLKEDHLLKNPPIVSEYNGKFVLLDGATRITALKQMSCCDVVVQVVDYEAPGMVLETWNHMLLDTPVDDLIKSLRAVSGLIVDQTSPASASAALEKRQAIATLLLADGQAYALRTAAGGKLEQQAKLLNEVVAAYEGRGEMYRVAHTDVERLLSEHGRLSVLVVFPRYSPDEIRRLAFNGAKLPMGVTRHIIPGRALRINIPLDILTREEPIEQKNAWLDEWMKAKMRERSVRFYQEPVFLFDE